MPFRAAAGWIQIRSSDSMGRDDGNERSRGAGAQPAVEHVGDGPSGTQSLMSPSTTTSECTDRFEVRQQLLHLEAALAHAQPEMRREHVHRRAADVDGRGEGAPRLASVEGEIEAMHLDDRMTRQQGVPEAPGGDLARRPEGAFVPVQRDELDGLPGLDRDARGVGELLQRHDVRVQFADDGGDAIRIVTPVGADTGVDVVGGDSQARAGRPHQPNSAWARWRRNVGEN